MRVEPPVLRVRATKGETGSDEVCFVRSIIRCNLNLSLRSALHACRPSWRDFNRKGALWLVAVSTFVVSGAWS